MNATTKQGKPRRRASRTATLGERVLLHTDRSGDCWRGPLMIPTSGTHRRRTKAIRNRRRVHARENDRLVAAGGLPRHFVALSTCPCGWLSWLEEGASDEDRADFLVDCDDHAAYCDGGAA